MFEDIMDGIRTLGSFFIVLIYKLLSLIFIIRNGQIFVFIAVEKEKSEESTKKGNYT